MIYHTVIDAVKNQKIRAVETFVKEPELSKTLTRTIEREAEITKQYCDFVADAALSAAQAFTQFDYAGNFNKAVDNWTSWSKNLATAGATAKTK